MLVATYYVNPGERADEMGRRRQRSDGDRPGLGQPWADRGGAGARSGGRSTVLQSVLRQLLQGLGGFERAGFEAFRADWATVDALAGRPVRVLSGESACDGVALGVAEDGGLRVRHADGERVHHAGEVSVRVAA